MTTLKCYTVFGLDNKSKGLEIANAKKYKKVVFHHDFELGNRKSRIIVGKN